MYLPIYCISLCVCTHVYVTVCVCMYVHVRVCMEVRGQLMGLAEASHHFLYSWLKGHKQGALPCPAQGGIASYEELKAISLAFNSQQRDSH